MPARQAPRTELAWGLLTVLVICLATGRIAWGGMRGLSLLPWWGQTPVLAYLLKTTFSLRGLLEAGRTMQRALSMDTDAAREELKALVSRNRTSIRRKSSRRRWSRWRRISPTACSRRYSRLRF